MQSSEATPLLFKLNGGLCTLIVELVVPSCVRHLRPPPFRCCGWGRRGPSPWLHPARRSPDTGPPNCRVPVPEIGA